MDRDKAKALIREFMSEVDGGCTSCGTDAVRCVARVMPEVPWLELLNEYRAEEGLGPIDALRGT